MSKVTIGQRNQRIVIEKPVAVKNSLGEESITWTEHAAAWAKVSNKTAGELDSGGRIATVATYWFLCSFVDGVANDMRVNWSGKTFDITDAHDPDGTREVLKITAFTNG